MEDSISITISSQPPSQYDIQEMCRRVMYVLIHEMTTSRPQRREFDKDTIWEEARTLYFSEYGKALSGKVFQELKTRQDIEDLGTTVRVTDQASKPEYQPPEGIFLRRTKIHFKEKDEENGFYELLVSGMPAVSLENGRYLANAQQLKILRDKYIEYIPDT